MQVNTVWVNKYNINEDWIPYYEYFGGSSVYFFQSFFRFSRHDLYDQNQVISLGRYVILNFETKI